MKIYIVTDGEYSDFHIEAVFTDEKKAKMYAALHHCGWIEEWESDSVEFDGKIDYCVVHKFNIGSCGLQSSCYYYNTEKITKVVKEYGHLIVYVSLNEHDEDRAKKIAQDMLAEYRAKLLM